MADYNMSDLSYEINLAAARCARNAVVEYHANHPESKDKGGPFVAGAIGPMNKTLSLSPDVNNPGFRSISFDEVADAFGLERPPRLPALDLEKIVSPMLWSFMRESRRVTNGRLKELKTPLRYPSVAEFLKTISKNPSVRPRG